MMMPGLRASSLGSLVGAVVGLILGLAVAFLLVIAPHRDAKLSVAFCAGSHREPAWLQRAKHGPCAVACSEMATRQACVRAVYVLTGSLTERPRESADCREVRLIANALREIAHGATDWERGWARFALVRLAFACPEIDAVVEPRANSRLIERGNSRARGRDGNNVVTGQTDPAREPSRPFETVCLLEPSLAFALQSWVVRRVGNPLPGLAGEQLRLSLGAACAP